MRWPFSGWGKREPQPSQGPAPAPPAMPRKISMAAVAASSRPLASISDAVPFDLPKPPPAVLPAGHKGMALDLNIESAQGWASSAEWSEGQAFLGFPYLATLAQRPEYRRGAEIFAREMTRKWIRLRATGDGEDDKADKLAVIEKALQRYKVQDIFRRAIEVDGLFGRAQIFIDVGATDNSLPLVMGPNTVKKGALKGFKVVEPVWTYPNGYDSINPLSPDFYRPRSWFVMGKEVHRDRLLTIVGREVPDLLKPSYAFGGISLTQMAKPYVDNWLRTRQSVSDLVHSFSTMTFSTNMTDDLSGGDGSATDARVQVFNNYRDNRGTFVLHNGAGDAALEEKLGNVTTPLGTLDALQAQALEQMWSIRGIPLAIGTGMQPSGLNASSEGEIRLFYDAIGSGQEDHVREPLQVVLEVIQLSELGEIDPEITFSFEPLWQMSEKEKAEIRKAEADTSAVYVTSGVLLPEEERARLAGQEDSLYPGLDLNIVPEPPGVPDVEEDEEEEDADAEDA